MTANDPAFPVELVRQYRAAQAEAQEALEQASVAQERARKATGALHDISARYRSAMDAYAFALLSAGEEG